MSEQIKAMQSVPVQSCELETLVDISKIFIPESMDKAERLESFLAAIKNPYVFKVGDICVKVRFNSDGPKLQKLLEELISSNLRND